MRQNRNKKNEKKKHCGPNGPPYCSTQVQMLSEILFQNLRSLTGVIITIDKSGLSRKGDLGLSMSKLLLGKNYRPSGGTGLHVGNLVVDSSEFSLIQWLVV